MDTAPALPEFVEKLMNVVSVPKILGVTTIE